MIRVDAMVISHDWDIEAGHPQAKHELNLVKYIVFQHDNVKQFDKKGI